MTVKPIPESYWVLPDRFLAGEYPLLRYDEAATRLRLASFLDAGINTFIDLTTPGERPEYLSLLKENGQAGAVPLQHLRFPIPDFEVPSPDTMRSILDAIDQALAGGRRVYLHCVGGVGRTGTVVGSWLVRHGREPQQALADLETLYRSASQSEIHPRSPENPEQARFILNWKEDGLA